MRKIEPAVFSKRTLIRRFHASSAPKASKKCGGKATTQSAAGVVESGQSDFDMNLLILFCIPN
ncbi:MAG TPA: hypothetical protein DCY17_03760 [Clostridiales bacterium]|nr:hypothetical protein [Clostridiales bacterium]